MQITDTDIKIIIGLLTGILGFMFKRERETGSILKSLETLKEDVDGIALIIGTPRALGKKAKEDAKKI